MQSIEKIKNSIANNPFMLARLIGDLPCQQCDVDVSTPVKKVVESLKEHSELPGVVLRRDGSFVGVLSRLKIFEWLGRPYGVELFFKRPVRRLFTHLNVSSTVYPKDTQIGEAVLRALSRPSDIRYEPLVVSFGEDDLRLLDINVLLLAQSDQLASANRVIEKQIEIGQTLSSTLELPKVFALILEQMEAIIPYSRAAILLCRDDNKMEFAASRGYPPSINMAEARTLINHNPTFSTVIESRIPAPVEDALLIPDWQHISGALPTRSWLGVPLVQNEKVLGMLSISRLMAVPFTAAEVEASSIFAGQSAIALGNARLHEEVQKVNLQLDNQRQSLQTAVEELNHANLDLTRRAMQLETSNKIVQQITSVLDIKLLLPQVLDILQSQFSYPWVSLWMMNESCDELALEAATKTSVKLGTTLPVTHKGAVAQAGRTGKVVCENLAGKSHRFVSTPGLVNTFSEIALPLIFQENVLGVLDIQSERLNAYSPDDIAVLQVTAAQIAIAVHHARLYAELMRLKKETKA
ncbi:MAG: GAF domain-containing protein [Anaerolineales bacterium]